MQPVDEPKIGDFSQPPMGAPKTPPTPSPLNAQASPVKEQLDAAAGRLSEDVAKDEAALKPMASYEERLRAAGLTKEKAAEIVDAVLLKGYYAEDIKVTSTIKLRLRTRNARDIKRVHEILEAQRFTIDAHYNEAWSRLLLAASIEAFGKDKFDYPNPRTATYEDVEKAYTARVNYVEGLAEPALRVLINKLWKFDNRVAVAIEEGAIENF